MGARCPHHKDCLTSQHRCESTLTFIHCHHAHDQQLMHDYDALCMAVRPMHCRDSRAMRGTSGQPVSDVRLQSSSYSLQATLAFRQQSTFAAKAS